MKITEVKNKTSCISNHILREYILREKKALW